MESAPSISECRISVYKIPTDRPESDGTLAWDATTMVLVELTAGSVQGLGYTYSCAGAALVIRDQLWPIVSGGDPFDIPALLKEMVGAIRNLGQGGIASMAISAVDVALWDLKARLLELPLASLLGRAREEVPIYGSGGFTSYTDDELREQTGGWAEAGIPRIKIKVGRRPEEDPHRLKVVREAIGEAELFVDANGGYSRKEAIAMMDCFRDANVRWFEEPVSSDDLAGLRTIRELGVPGIEIAAGEYGFRPDDFRRMLEADAVDVLQADATRCRGVSGFLQAAAVCDSFHIPFSAHCAPTLHVHLGCAVKNFRHLEYFHDHVRIESMLFEGFVVQERGAMRPRTDRPGLGIAFKHKDVERYIVDQYHER